MSASLKTKVLKRPRVIAREGDEEHWIPLSDLMTSLMFLFLLVALAYMVQVQQQSTRTVKIIDDYRLQRDALYTELDREFHRDLRDWDAELTPDLTLRFYKPDVLFKKGSATLQPRFAQILGNFFPRYVRILDSLPFRSAVKELRIQGTASSGWQNSNTAEKAYLANMALSQDRARAVLAYVLPLENVRNHRDWLLTHVTADGLSSSHPVFAAGKEDSERSQRVDFRVMDPVWDRVEQTVATEHAAAQRALQATASGSAVQRPKGPVAPYSIDAVVVPDAEPMVINLDAHPVVAVSGAQALSITGWATNRTSTSAAGAVYARLDGSRVVKANYGSVRDDVAYALRNAALDHVGFRIDIAPNTLSAGEHRVDFVIMNAQGKTDLVARDRLTLRVR